MGRLLDLPTELFQGVVDAVAERDDLPELFRLRAVCSKSELSLFQNVSH